MKRLSILFYALILIGLSGCSIYDMGHAYLASRVEKIDKKITELENKCMRMNENMASLQALVEAQLNRDCITDVTQVTENGRVVGYEISFIKANPITIHHGAGDDSDRVPQIGIRKDSSDGRHYWVYNGDWLLDDQGDRVQAVGVDGRVPMTKIEDGDWYVSYDMGESWDLLGKATEPEFFSEIGETDTEVRFVLSDGTELIFPKPAPLDITFSEGIPVVMDPESTLEISYAVSGNYGEAFVELMCSGKIKARLVPAEGGTGTIFVETSDVIDEYCKVIVWVSDEQRTIVRTLLFSGRN